MAEYIEREDILSRFAEAKEWCEKHLAKGEFRAGCIAALDDERSNFTHGIAITTADVVEVKHGKWINVQDFGGGKCFADCSICRTQEKAPNPTAFKMFRRYCSYCGAKMDLKEGTEE